MTEDMYRRQERPQPNQDMNALIIGCGGVGAMSAITMACTGAFSNLFLVDGDEFERSNFNRLPIPLEYEGWNKAEAVADYIEQVRPNVNCTVWPYYMETEEDAEKIKYGTSYQRILFAADGLETNQFMREYFYRYITNERVLFVGTDENEITLRSEPVEWGTGDNDGYANVSIYNILQTARCVADIMIQGIAHYGHSHYRSLDEDTFDFRLLKAINERESAKSMRDHYETEFEKRRSEVWELESEIEELKKDLAAAKGDEEEYIDARGGEEPTYTANLRREKEMRKFAIKSNNKDGVVNVS